MTDQDTASESRWRMSRQTMAVRDLTNDLRAAVTARHAADPRWPVRHADEAAELAGHLQDHAGALDDAEAAAERVDTEHRTAVAASALITDEVDRVGRELVAAREHLLHAAVAADTSAIAVQELNARIERLASLLG